MFGLKAVLLSFFGWLVLLGSTDQATLPSALYHPVDSITATDNEDHVPLFFDAIIDANHSSTYETPPVKILSPNYEGMQVVSFPNYYPLSYYSIGQQISIHLTTKTIIFPFHCFT